MKILIINGPNLNLLGLREPEIYGTQTFDDYLKELRRTFADVEIDYFQSNHEGSIIDRIHEAGYGPSSCDAIVINPGAYAHYSIAIADALRAVPLPAIEVHISDIHAREEFRHTSVTAPACRNMICGLGLPGYEAAVRTLIQMQSIN